MTLRLPWVFADSGPKKCSPTPLSLRGNIHQLCTLDPWILDPEGEGG